MPTANFIILNGEVHDIPPSKLPAVRNLVATAERKFHHGDILYYQQGKRVITKLVIRTLGGLVVTDRGGTVCQKLNHYLYNPEWKFLCNIFKDQTGILVCFK